MSSRLVAVNECVKVASIVGSRRLSIREKLSALRLRLQKYVHFYVVYFGIRRVGKLAINAALLANKKSTYGLAVEILATTAAQTASRAFTWNQGLLVVLHRLTKYTGRRHLSLEALVALHLVHNYFMTSRADWMSPSYIRLWTSIIPDFSFSDYMQCFGSDAKEFPQALSGVLSDEEKDKFFSKIKRIFLAQSSVVSLIYGISLLFSVRNSLHRKSTLIYLLARVPDTTLRVLRTSLVLTILPCALIYYPIFEQIIAGKKDKRTILMRLRHTIITSAISVSAFLLEPEKRLNTIVVYTAWRIVEAMLRIVFKSLRDEEIEGKVNPHKSSFVDLRRYFGIALCTLGMSIL
eukprot:jgi/Bigna1/133215/aug1.20_g7923